MRKSRIIAIILAVAVMLMGAGYAAWTDTLEINNTVSTGNFNLQFACLDGGDYDNINNPNAFNPGDSDYVNNGAPGSSQVQVIDDHNISFTHSNFYPGSGAWLKFRVLNSGTVPAKVKEIRGIVNEGAYLKDSFRYTIETVKLVELQSGVMTVVDEIYTDRVEFDTFDGFKDELSHRLSHYPDGSEIILNSGQWLEVNGTEQEGIGTGFDIYLPITVGNTIDGTEATTTEDTTFDFDLELVYQQWNQ